MNLSMLILPFLLRYVQPAIASASDLDVRQASADSSNTRSLWSIVSGCVATIFACTWISVHSNIPAPTDSLLQVLRRRLAIMLISLIAPEFVIMWAARQYIASREICKRHKARGWTKTHAFFVIMGGFSLYENGKLVRTLDIFELEKLEAEGKVDWPIITGKEIKDKSKGDYFSKGVVVLQTCWFIAQVIARGAEHMVVTELEVVTLAFSVLTMILYFLWWNKPLDVGVSVPVHLKDGFSTPEVALTTPPLLDQREFVHQTIRQIPSRLWALGRYFFPDGTPTADGIPTTDDTGPHESTDQVERLESQANENARPIFTPEDQLFVSRLQDIEMQALPLESRQNFQSTRSSSQHDSASVRVSANSSKSNRRIWTDIIIAIFRAIFRVIFLAMSLATLLAFLAYCIAITAVPFILFIALFEFLSALYGMWGCKQLNKKHPTRVPTFYCPKSESEKISYIIVIGVATGFGSIHCIAWFFPFPSFPELWLWRITSILVTALPVVITAATPFGRLLLRPIPHNEDDSKNLHVIDILMTIKLRLIVWLFFSLLYSALVVGYIGARLCLLVLPFCALRASPEGAYDDVDWTAFVPHI